MADDINSGNSKKSSRDLISFSQIAATLPEMTMRLPKAAKAVWHLRTVSAEKEVSLGDYFLKTVKKYPDNRVLFYNDINWTYTEFNHWINRLGIYFLSLGFKKGDTAAVFLENRPEVLAISMALAKIGCVAALVNSSQRNKPLMHSIHLAKPKLVLVGAELIDSYLEVKDVKLFILHFF